MAEAIAIVGVASTICSLQQAIEKLEIIFPSRYGQLNARLIEVEVLVGSNKLEMWQSRWPTDERHPDVSAEALWGAKGWSHIRRMLDEATDTGQSIIAHINELQKAEDTKPRSKLRKAIKAIQARKGRPNSTMQQLLERSKHWTRVIDVLWIYSETAFESRHPIPPLESKVPERDRLLQIALHSRPCALDLYSRCSTSPLGFSLEMDILGPNSTDSKIFPTSYEDSPSVFYHLIARSREDNDTLQEMTIERLNTSANPKLDATNIVFHKMDDVKLFDRNTAYMSCLVEVASRGSTQPSCLRIPQRYIQNMRLKSEPESLADILDRLRSADFSTTEHLSVGAKVELAYKVIECGFFLLGTPWFASLSTKSLLRLKNTKKWDHSFCLQTETLDLEDLLDDDPNALAETSQLFRLGVLLMEIALNKTDLYSESDETGQEADWINNLSLVEQNMGPRYCSATAFCLQYRHSGKPFKGDTFPKDSKASKIRKSLWEAEKYEDPNFDGWLEYLGGLLQEYYSQVYVRIRDLREVDSGVDFRSRKSWQVPVDDEDDR